MIARCFGVDEAFGFALPVAQELLHLAVVGDGTAHEQRLLGREPAAHELAALHVPPVVVGSVARRGILGAAAAGLAAAAQVLVERARAQVLGLADGGANLLDALT